MKIAFVGKGGSGKTTASSMFTRYLYEKGSPVLAVDADINQHLHDALHLEGLEHPKKLLGHDKDALVKMLIGANQNVTPGLFKPSTPLGKGSHIVKIDNNDTVIKYFASNLGSLFLAEVGEFDKADTNKHCYHFRQKAAEMLLSHIISRKNEYVVFDMTAGADSFASGLFGKFDLTLLVVEPTTKSLSVFKQYKSYSNDHGINLAVIGNKIEDPSDEEFIVNQVGADVYIGSMPKSLYIKRLERGDRPSWEDVDGQMLEVLGRLKQRLDSIDIDYDLIQQKHEQIHRLASAGQPNELELIGQIDQEFSLKSVA